jgi:hypothetical protein
MWRPTVKADGGVMTTTAPVQQASTPPRGAWGWGVWVLVIVGAAVEAVAAIAATLFINWGASTSCGDAATMSNVREGEMDLAFAAGVFLVPWAIAMFISPRRLRLGVAAAAAISPLLVGMVAGLNPQFWTNGWCF